MHRLVKITGSCVLSAALILGVSPLASFGLQAASAADTPKETPTTEQDAQSDPATYAAEALEDGDTFVYEDLIYTVTNTDGTLEAMLGHYVPLYDDGAGDPVYDENAPTNSFSGGDVVLPGTVTYEGVDYEVTAIDAYAFYRDASITSLTIPASITTIGEYAFFGCYNVATLNLSEGLVNVDNYGLAVGTGSAITGASGGQSSLKELTIPATVQTIGTGGFAYLRYLEKLAFTDTEGNPSQLISIGGSAFICASNSVNWYNGVLTEIRIPAGVTSIGSAAFAYHTAIQNVVFECDTTDMRYQTSSSSSTSGWFYKMTVTDDTAVLFMKGSAPRNWDSSIPGYMLVDFYPSEDDAMAETNALGRAAVAYGTSSAQMAADPTSVTVYDPVTYGNVPTIPDGYTLWQYRDIDEYLTITAAGALYPADVQINDLQYATVTMEVDGTETVIPDAFDYDDFDAEALIGSLKVVDLLGNILTAGTDYEASIEHPAAIGPATLTVSGIGDYSGAYVHEFTIELSAFEAADESGHTFTYQVIDQPTFAEDGTVTAPGTVSLGNGSDVAYAGSASLLTTLVVPSEASVSVEDDSFTFTVTKVAASAFSKFTALRSVTLPPSVADLDKQAFYNCTALSEVNYSEGLQTIGDDVFSGCISLESMTFPNSLTKLGSTISSYAASGSLVFQGCASLQEVTFGTEDGGGSCTIATDVFNGCKSLQKVALNGNVTAISHLAFYEIDSLTTLTGFENVTDIGIWAFYGCSSLSVFDEKNPGLLSLTNSDLTIFARAFAGCTSITALRIDGGITFGSPNATWDEGANAGYTFENAGFKEIEFVGTWETIPNGIFASCASLESVTLPDTVTSIDSSAFSGCTGLKTVVLPEQLASIASSAFQGCASLVEIVFKNDGNTLVMGSQVFANCTSLQSITLPEGLTELPEGCFSGCSTLEEVGLPSSLVSIGSSCFGNYTYSMVGPNEGTMTACTSLKTIDLPESVTYIGSSAFDGCSALSGPLDLSNITNLTNYTFRDCASLDGVTVASDASLGIGVFYGCTSLTTFSDGSAASGVVLPEGMGEMGRNAFYGCSAIESLSVPAAIATVPQGAFSGCSSLIDLTLSEGVGAVGQESFANCTSLVRLATPESLTEIGTSSFAGCSKLADLQLSEGLESIGRQSFADCTALPYVVLPSTVSSIASGAFNNCYDLDAVDCTDIDVSSVDFASDAFITGNFDTCLVFVQMEAPSGLAVDNGHVLSVTCPEKVTYTGKELTPVVLTCTDGADPSDFTWVDYAGNVTPGTASATVYVGAYEIDFTFEIENDGTYDPNNPPGSKQPITASMVSNIPTQYYTGKAIKPAVKVGSYKQGSDYTVSYTNNVNIGTAKATITPTASIGGSPVTKTFKITVKKNAAYKVGSVTYKIASTKTNGKGTVTLSKCKKGKNVTVPSKVKIGGVSFKVAEIGAKAFKGAKKLKNIQIASSVKKIGKKAFFGCKKLKVLVFNGKKVPKLGKQSFAKTSTKVTVGVKAKPAKAEKKLRKAGLSKKAAVVRG